MLTDREQQILGWIRANPSISQQEIAGVLSVSTSAVRRARDELVQNKYIYYLEGRKRHPGEYVLLSCRDPKRLMCGGPSQVLMLQLKD